MADNILNATVATVKIGYLEFEGLMLEDGSFAIAVPQLCSIFQFLNKNASRDINAVLGASFQFLKARTTLHPKAVNVVRLPAFRKIIFRLVLKGNTTAIEISEDLLDLSLEQMFSDAFNKSFTKIDRQDYLKAKQKERARTKETIKLMESDIYKWSEGGTRYAVNIPFWVHFYNTMDYRLFGKFAKTIREEQFDKHALIRDGMCVEALRRISEIQYITMRHLNQHTLPWDALNKALNEKNFPVMDWREPDLKKLGELS